MNTFISTPSERWHMCGFGLLPDGIVAANLGVEGWVIDHMIKRLYIQIRRRTVSYRQLQSPLLKALHAHL
ncbi:hypothetical protein, partial [Pseudomonas syringae]|uniref:hypothetical protein n=1 Tax=Pseudomonas syringae TaxID=317 RepID=UPI0019D3222E